MTSYLAHPTTITKATPMTLLTPVRFSFVFLAALVAIPAAAEQTPKQIVTAF